MPEEFAMAIQRFKVLQNNFEKTKDFFLIFTGIVQLF